MPFGRSEADPMGETLLKKPPEGDFGIDSRAPPESFEIECAPPGDLRLDDDRGTTGTPYPRLPDPLLFGGLVDVLVVATPLPTDRHSPRRRGRRQKRSCRGGCGCPNGAGAWRPTIAS